MSDLNILLNDLSARLGCDILAEDETVKELSTQFTDTRLRVSTIADEIMQLASQEDALAFTSKLSTFIEGERAKALETNRLRDEIAERQARLTEAQEELGYLSAGRAALAQKVSAAMLALEAAQRDYAANDLRLGIIERTIESTRLERSALRRQLAELTKSKEVKR